VRLLKDILFRTRIQEVIGSTNVAVEHVAMDSRLVKPFSLFVAVSGTVVDGHEFITKAIESGATAIVCERLPENKNANILI
jgi:UDP-N-acetylmuramoyl-L-alanyl-D-glutamate--2,6-diaminopimelate ligase